MDWDEEKYLVMALNNIQNLFRAVAADQAEVRLLANGSAVKLFTKEHSLPYAVTVEKLFESGVRFLLCNNSLHNFNIDKSDLMKPCQVIPAGIVELIRLQNDGYAYIKP